MRSSSRLSQITEQKMKWFCAVLLLGWSLMIVYITRQQLISLYVAPRMEWLVKGSALICYILGIFQIYLAIVPTKHSDPTSCNCSSMEVKHKRSLVTTLSSSAAALTLLLPFIMSYIWPPMPLSSQTAALKGVQYAPSASLKQWTSTTSTAEQPDSDKKIQTSAPNTETPTFEADEFTQMYADLAKKLYSQDVIVVTEKQYMEIILTLDLFKEQFVGKRIRIPGFIYKDKEMEPGRFAIARFSMQCCTADASPFGILSANHTKQNVKADEWVEGEGVLTIAKHENNKVMLLKIDSLRSIPAKEDPYVYPDIQFGS